MDSNTSVPDERARRFFAWFYDDHAEPTVLWRHLERVARGLPPGYACGDVVDQVVEVLLGRLRANPATILPLRVAPEHPLEAEADYLDVLRYCQTAVRNAVKQIQHKAADSAIPLSSMAFDEDEFEPTDEFADPEFFPGRRAYWPDPTSGPVLDGIVTARNLECWIAALDRVHRALVSVERLAHPNYRAACVAFLQEFIGGVRALLDGAREHSENAGTVETRATAHALRALAHLSRPPVRLVRAFEAQFHHAFWRSAGTCMDGQWASMEFIPAFARISALAGIDGRAFMADQHAGMLRSWPLPFTPRGCLNGVTKRALLARGRESLWAHLVRVDCGDADPWPPPTAAVLGEEPNDA